MTKIFDIFKNFNQIKSHKRAKIIRSKSQNTPTIEVIYYGKLESGGFRAKLKTIKDTKYQINFCTRLIHGDIAFIYCEGCDVPGHHRRLLSRDDPNNLILNSQTQNQRSIQFTAKSDETYIGILMYNANVEYQLKIYEFNVCLITDSSKAINITSDDIYELPSRADETWDEVMETNKRNHQILLDMLDIR